ncbi:MAG: hypothetical protein IKL92_01050 [Oscillospiraceae bacterium]|nr:hypothetical protein [Oscillospiraceae bacterium]
MVTGAMLSLLIAAAALILGALFSLEERIAKLEEERYDEEFEPVDRHPDKLFLEWIYGGDE